ncbi:MAG: hypothetical protein LBP59_04170 [Planctomycetaceae bacterium]|nr:hypothetical protein [Planctomycetaceae bacterium]
MCNKEVHFKLFALEFSFTFACLAFGRQALTLLNCSYFNLRFTFACLAFGRQALTLLNRRNSSTSCINQ